LGEKEENVRKTKPKTKENKASKPLEIFLETINGQRKVKAEKQEIEQLLWGAKRAIRHQKAGKEVRVRVLVER